jgi:hypothetical protein
MIRKHNAIQVATGIGRLCLGLTAMLLAYLFFAFALYFVGDSFGLRISRVVSRAVSLLVCGVILGVGYGMWRRGENPEDLPLPGPDIEPVSGGAWAVRNRAQRVTGPAYLLTQVFLAGPLQILKWIGQLRSVIRYSPQYEARLFDLLGAIRAEPRWLPLDSVEEYRREVADLIRMGYLDFSAKEGKIKARSS